MEFETEKAREIITRFGLYESTLKVWKTRNSIPERYFREGFEIKPKAEGERDAQGWRDIQRILGYGKINIMSVSRLTEIPENRIKDIIYKNIIPSKDEVLSLKKAINVLRIEAMQVLSLFNQFRISEMAWSKLKAFLLRDEIKHFSLIGDKPVAKKTDDLMRGVRSTPAEYQKEVVQALGVFITETTITFA